MEKLTNQSEWIERAKEVLPAGGFGNFDPSIFIREGRGSRVWDEDGNEYEYEDEDEDEDEDDDEDEGEDEDEYEDVDEDKDENEYEDEDKI